MEIYTPGHNGNATDFMSRRTLQSHGEFFSRLLAPGMHVLDLGCGPGTITLGIAARVQPGRVTGVDFGESQIAKAQELAAAEGVTNVEFLTGSAYAAPLEDSSVHAVFSHALFEHLQFPATALEEIWRVLKPGGQVALCSPDWGGFLLAPHSAEVEAALAAYTNLQSANGGDVRAGRKLGDWLSKAGFQDVRMEARYECYESLPHIAHYLAEQLRRAGEERHAAALEAWSEYEGGMFAQAWVAATARKP